MQAKELVKTIMSQRVSREMTCCQRLIYQNDQNQFKNCKKKDD